MFYNIVYKSLSSSYVSSNARIIPQVLIDFFNLQYNVLFRLIFSTDFPYSVKELISSASCGMTVYKATGVCFPRR